MKANPLKDSILWLRAASLKSFHGWEIILTSTVIFCIKKGHRPLALIWERNSILAWFSHNIFTSVVYCGISLNHKLLIHLDKWHATGLSMNGMWSHSHVPTPTSICLDVLSLYVQNFIWEVNCKSLCSVILLQIIHLQLDVKLGFHL